MSRLLPISLLVVCILQAGCSSEPTVDELLQRGRNAIKVEDWESVREIKNKLAKRKAAQIETQFLEANLYMNVLNYDAVMQRVGVIASDKRIREDCMMLAVHCFTAIQDMPSAMRTLEEIAAEFPDNVDTHRLLIANYYDFGALQQAMRHSERVSELAPEDPRPDRLMGLISKDFEKNELAITHYLESLQRAETDLTFDQVDEIRTELAEVYIRLRKYQEAKKQLEQLSADAAPSVQATAFAYRAECAMALGDFVEAEQLVRQCIRKDPTLPDGQRILGLLAMQTGKPEDAKQALENAARLDPGNDRVFFQLSNVLRQLGQTDAADAAYNKHQQIKTLKLEYIELNVQAAQQTDNASVRVRIASIAEQLGDYQAAVSWYRGALGIDPENEKALTGIRRVSASPQQ
ncbi:MAG: tetratricopeptide repeat protein [Pirellulaceae bacterium]